MSTGVGRTEVIDGPFENREAAQVLERELQRTLDAGARISAKLPSDVRIPDWAHGVRVEKANKHDRGSSSEYVVVATEHAR